MHRIDVYRVHARLEETIARARASYGQCGKKTLNIGFRRRSAHSAASVNIRDASASALERAHSRSRSPVLCIGRRPSLTDPSAHPGTATRALRFALVARGDEPGDWPSRVRQTDGLPSCPGWRKRAKTGRGRAFAGAFFFQRSPTTARGVLDRKDGGVGALGAHTLSSVCRRAVTSGTLSAGFHAKGTVAVVVDRAGSVQTLQWEDIWAGL